MTTVSAKTVMVFSVTARDPLKLFFFSVSLLFFSIVIRLISECLLVFSATSYILAALMGRCHWELYAKGYGQRLDWAVMIQSGVWAPSRNEIRNT